MSNQIPKAEWAIEKVRIYGPKCAEKVTLMAIAGYMNYHTGLCFVRKELLARDIGKDARTVQRHIQRLERSGHLVIERPDRYQHHASIYRIPCCSFSVEELEFLTGIDANQLELRLIDNDEPGTGLYKAGTLKGIAERQWETNCLPPGDKMSWGGRQNVSHNMDEQQQNNDPAQISFGNGEMALLKKKKKTTMLQHKHVEPLPPANDLAPETEKLIKGVLDTLMERSQDAPVGVGTRLREEFDRKFGPAVDRPV